MCDFQAFIHDKTAQAISLHKSERRTTIESVRLVGELEARRAWFHMGMNVESYAAHIGLSPSMYWKRVKVARLFRFHPRAAEIFERGECELSHLVAIESKITEANAPILFKAIVEKSRRELEAFLSRVGPDGTLQEGEGLIDFTARLKESEFALIERAREVLAHGGKVPSNADILKEALEVLLDKKDPLRKAERAQRRQEKGGEAMPREVEWTPTFVTVCPDEVSVDETSEADCAPGHKGRRSIPAAVRHRVWIRDGGSCTFVNPDASRCGSKMMLEIDHLTLYCRGGSDELSNLTLRCRYHNQLGAETDLGRDFMEERRQHLFR